MWCWHKWTTWTNISKGVPAWYKDQLLRAQFEAEFADPSNWHADSCNIENPCAKCLAVPKHNYVGPIDRADCQVCGYSIDMVCHSAESGTIPEG